jgi:crossover junction endodeoxyribonuclease RuvC
VIILGIDPGLATVGWGAVDYRGNRFRTLGFGTVTTPAGKKTADRLIIIYDRLREIIEEYRPDAVAIEELFWNTNQTTGIRVAQARGVILLCAAQHGISVAEYTPLQVKQAVVGYGRADKHQVISMVTVLLGLSCPPAPDDTADALAVAICHAHSGCSRIAQLSHREC